MKIAFVVHDFLGGVGHGRYCIELARRFAGEHEVHVLANRFEKCADFDFQRHVVPAWRKTALTSVLTFAGAAQRILESEPFDIVHAQGFSCWRADVVTAHVCNAARYARSPAPSVLKGVFPKVVIPREKKFFQTSGAQAVISVSRRLQKELSEWYGVSSEVIYHGIDTARFRPAAPPENKKWTWLFAGEAAKGLEQVVSALKEFPEAELSVASRSDLSAFRGIERVNLLGPVADMPALYAKADVFVYPSAYDTFAMVVAEAMASGLPVVIGSEIGAAEWIQDGQNGFMCDPSSLASVMSKLKALPPAELQNLRKKARETALSHSWDECARQTMEVYQRAISSKRAKR